ncbi:MAG: hypothetical protein ACKVX9_13455 [Blastocatellia bacterium]
MPDQYKNRPVVVCLSSLFATDRMLLYTSFLDRLLPQAEPLILSDAVKEAAFPQSHPHRRLFQSVELPAAFPYKYTIARHFETYLWDHQGLSFSRESFWRLKKSLESPRWQRAMRGIAKPLARLGIEDYSERTLAEALIHRAAPQAAMAWLREAGASAVFVLYPFMERQMVMVAAAKRLGLPVIALITSWDNLSTKARMVFQYDAYLVWSEEMKRELHSFYPRTQTRPVTVIGAPQYDVFFRDEFQLSRDEFLRSYGLDPARPVILYCLGSPNMIREDFGAREYIDRVSADPARSHWQIIVRPHPGFSTASGSELDAIKDRHPGVIIQESNRHWQRFPVQGEGAIAEWVNTLRHADVVIQLASTMAVDAALFDRPVINVHFDPQPGGPNEQMIREVNSRWNHFAPIARSGGVCQAASIDAMIAATDAYLRSPELHRSERRWIVDYVCGPADGQAGRRMAEAVLSVIES